MTDEEFVLDQELNEAYDHAYKTNPRFREVIRLRQQLHNQADAIETRIHALEDELREEKQRWETFVHSKEWCALEEEMWTLAGFPPADKQETNTK